MQYETIPTDTASAKAHMKNGCQYCVQVKRADGFCIRHRHYKDYVYDHDDWWTTHLTVPAWEYAAIRDALWPAS